MSWLPTARSAARLLLRERAWLAALVGVVVLSVLFVFLGRWQYQRHEARSLRSDRIAANYDAEPVPLVRLLPGVAADPTVTLPRELEWRPVRVAGRYLTDATVVVRNRPMQGQPGYEVLVPLALDGVGDAGSRVLLVDRGWLPTGATGTAPDRVPPPPQGPVEVVVRLRPGEPGIDRPAPRGQALRIDLKQIADSLGRPLVGAYGVLDTETPAAGEAPKPLPRPDLGTDINLPYAVQWYAFALVAYLLLGWGAVREVRRRRAATPSPDRSVTPPHGRGAAAGP